MGAKDEKTGQELDACCIDCPARAERTVSISGLCGLFRAVSLIFGTDLWFLAVTTHERLLVSRFSLLTIPMKQQAFALQTLQKLSVRQIPLLKTRKITMQFQSTGKVESLRCFCSPKTFGMGLPNQEMQLQQLLETLNLWSTRSDLE